MLSYLKRENYLQGMAKEKFLLVSLHEEKSKRLAQVLSNDTSRHILDYLADREATESELAKALNLPLSTVHYNLQALIDGGLVVAEEFHYSEKGKEVMHYKLANKYIIIAPKSVFGVKEKLRSILPTIFIIGVVALIIQFFIRLTTRLTEISVAGAAAPAQIVQESAVMKAALDQTAGNMTQVPIAEKMPLVSDFVTAFVLGAFLALLIYLLIEWIRKRRY